jgi:hypothetical protein
VHFFLAEIVSQVVDPLCSTPSHHSNPPERPFLTAHCGIHMRAKYRVKSNLNLVPRVPWRRSGVAERLACGRRDATIGLAPSQPSRTRSPTGRRWTGSTRSRTDWLRRVRVGQLRGLAGRSERGDQALPHRLIRRTTIDRRCGRLGAHTRGPEASPPQAGGCAGCPSRRRCSPHTGPSRHHARTGGPPGTRRSAGGWSGGPGRVAFGQEGVAVEDLPVVVAEERPLVGAELGGVGRGRRSASGVAGGRGG